MIASLFGRIGGRMGNAVIVETASGVGYQVHVAASTLENLGMVGDDVRLLVITQVREDAIQLYGFVDEAERDAFQLFTKVQGVGASIALNLLSAQGADGTMRAIATENRAGLTVAQGVGPKLAVRLITELKDKVLELRPDIVSSTPAKAIVLTELDGEGAAREALQKLGYSAGEIVNMIKAVAVMQPAPTGADAILRACLKSASNKF